MSNPFDNKHDHKQVNSNQSAESIKLHNRDDVDSGSNAHHHTLGPGHNQAAPGDHEHGSKWSTGDLKLTFAAADNVEWYECNGQASPTPELEAMFGPNLPDLKDRYPIGYNDAVFGRGLKDLGGSFFQSIDANHLPQHTHPIDHDHASFTTPLGGDHIHNMTFRESTTSGGPQNIAATGAGTAATRSVGTTSTQHQHSIDVPAYTGNSGNNTTTHDSLVIVPPYVGVRYLVHV